MRIVISLVAVLYVLAAFYGYFWWSDRQEATTQTQVSQAISTAPEKVPAEQLKFPNVMPVEDSSSAMQVQRITQQLNSMQTSFAAQLQQADLKQQAAFKNLQKQIDDLKQQQAQGATPTKTTEPLIADSQPITTNANPPSTEQLLEAQAVNAKQRLKADMSQLDLNLQAEAPDLARQSNLQQKVEDAFNQAELANMIQGRTECGQVFCKLDLQGRAPEGVDVLQALWEQQVFPEATEVLTVPKPDGSGWIVYVARDGQSLPTIP